MDLVPIKVKLGLRPNGHADHPDWGVLQAALGGDDPETHMFYGWHYDRTSGHRTDTPESPIGYQFGVKLVTAALATAALSEWPMLVTVLNETELEDFWNNKARAHTPEVKTDAEVITGLRAERALRVEMQMFTTAIDKEIEEALDPDNPKPGSRRDEMARWATAKARLDVTIVAP